MFAKNIRRKSFLHARETVVPWHHAFRKKSPVRAKLCWCWYPRTCLRVLVLLNTTTNCCCSPLYVPTSIGYTRVGDIARGQGNIRVACGTTTDLLLDARWYCCTAVFCYARYRQAWCACIVIVAVVLPAEGMQDDEFQRRQSSPNSHPLWKAVI